MAAWQLLRTLIRNRNAYTMNRDMIGFTAGRCLPPIRREDVLAFAAATRDHNPAYQEKGGGIPPFLLYKLTFPVIRQLWCHPDLHVNLLRGVYADQRIVWHAPVMQGDQLDIRVTLTDIADTPVGEKIKASATATRNGYPVISSETGFIVRSRKRSGQKITPAAALKAPLLQTTLQTEKKQPLLFARASGDDNFIHTSRILSRLAGLRRPVMHGACVMAMICAALSDKLLKGDITRLTAMEGRFGKPTYPGDLLTLVARETDSAHSVAFTVLNTSGDTVFKNGIFSYKGEVCT